MVCRIWPIKNEYRPSSMKKVWETMCAVFIVQSNVGLIDWNVRARQRRSSFMSASFTLLKASFSKRTHSTWILHFILSINSHWLSFWNLSINGSSIIQPTKQITIVPIFHSHFFSIWNFSDSFVNSQEWTLSRAVPDLRLGIVGSLASGKSALVHRYLTGSYMQEESPEGGRFKKEISIDGQSYLLLIRDEGGSPELQVSFQYIFLLFEFHSSIRTSSGTVENQCVHARCPAFLFTRCDRVPL